MMSTIDLLTLQSYSGAEDSSAPAKRGGSVAQRLPLISGGSHIIQRPRLTRLLDGADSPLLLLVAPAGYGKTTLAREWLGSRDRKGIWFRVTPACTEPAALALELAHVLDAVRPGIARRVADHLKVVESPDVEILGELLVDSDEEWPSGAWFVVDDYHLVLSSSDAERLLEGVCRAVDRVLIASRERPSWVDARVLLYGKAFELGQSALAMTHEEAEAVLTSAQRKPAGLVALANGWPAVIGLAALLPEGITPPVDVPAELHEFLAQELYNTLDAETRRVLVLLSLPDVIDLGLLSVVLGADAEPFVAQAAMRGFLGSGEDGTLEMHPLVRSFLLQRVPQERHAIGGLVRAVVGYLMDARAWDEAFSVIDHMTLVEVVPDFIGRAAHELLESGRSMTLDTWLRWAADHRVEAPELVLARAELLLRVGSWSSAASLAEASSRALSTKSLRAHALICAGRAALLAGQRTVATKHFKTAFACDDALETRRQALWGRFISASPDDDAAVMEAVAGLEQVNDPSPSHVLRVHEAHLILAVRNGGIAAAADRGIAASSLLDLVKDPLMRSAFLNHLSYVVRLAARYEEALAIAELELEEAHERFLDFVVPEALLNRASARLGTGDHVGALADIVHAGTHADQIDPYLAGNLAVTKARVLISRRDIVGARDAAEKQIEDTVRDDLLSEVVSTRALIAACSGEYERALVLQKEALEIAKHVEVRVLSAATRAIVEVSSSGNAIDGALADFAEEVATTGNLDSAICALRAEPRLAEAASAHEATREIVVDAAIRTRDPVLARASGTRVSPKLASAAGKLSHREREVLSHVAQGLTNPAIGERMFISPATVKTHLQNVFEKLGARSRTDAVVRATESGELGGQ